MTGVSRQGHAGAADRAEVARRVRSAGSSFYWAMRLMDARRRAALFAIYAFCREVDDIADGDLSAAQKQAALLAWRQRLVAIRDGRDGTSLGRVLFEAIAAYGLEQADFEAVIAGMEMDARGPIVAPDEATLDLYCDRVASAVGRLCVRVFGAPEAAGRELAGHLGRALQLTNIIRDVEEDARMGRLYLPDGLLARHGIRSHDPLGIAGSPALAAVRRDLAGEAGRAFRAAAAALARCDRGDLRPAIIMMKVYERVFRRMVARDFRPPPPGRLARLGEKLARLAIALRHLRRRNAGAGS